LSRANEGNTSDKTFLNIVLPCIHRLCLYSCISASFHVDTAAKELPLTEVEEPEAKYQEEQQPEYVIADQASEQDFANFET